MAQRAWVKCVPEVPGGYYTPRYLDFAFKDVINTANASANLNQSVFLDSGGLLQKAAKTINDEISLKRKEFGMDE